MLDAKWQKSLGYILTPYVQLKLRCHGFNLELVGINGIIPGIFWPLVQTFMVWIEWPLTQILHL